MTDGHVHHTQQISHSLAGSSILCNTIAPQPHLPSNGTSTYAAVNGYVTLTNGHNQHYQQQSKLQPHNSYYAAVQAQPLLDSPVGGVTGSTSSSSRTIAATKALGDVQCGNDRDIYYVSPSKRKTSMLRNTNMNLNGNCALIAAAYPSALPASHAYGVCAAGAKQDFSFDSCETASHYSDTAMQLLRSGSCSAETGLLSLEQQIAQLGTNGNLTDAAASTLARTHGNVVTFGKQVGACKRAELVSKTPPLSASSTLNHGSLRRNKGRSNQSLCSCDAGADTEINPDPTRPLYQYALEGKHKRHTYTCEQNAQILMRLERERNRKLSASGLSLSECRDELRATNNDDVQNDTPSCSDLENIPPAPPPPLMKRNGSVRSLHRNYARAPTFNNNSINVSTLCNGSELINDCASNVLEVGSLMEDCTSSILKCANAMSFEILPGTASSGTASHHKSNVATLATMASSSKPDVCHVTKPFNNYAPSTVRDDILAPSAKKTDPALCFLHVGPTIGLSSGTQLSASNTAVQPVAQRALRSALRRGKYNTIGPSSDYIRQLVEYQGSQQQDQQLKVNAQPTRITERCRCISQSLSNFSRDYFGQSGHKGPMRDLPLQHIYHTGAAAKAPLPSAASFISRSYGNLVDMVVDVDQYQNKSQQLSYEKFQANSSLLSGSSGDMSSKLIDCSITNLTSASSGLKEKCLKQNEMQQKMYPHQPQLHQQHPHRHQLQSQNSLHKQLQHQQPQHQQQQLQLHSTSPTSIMPWKHRQSPSRGSSSSGTNSFRFDAAKNWLAVTSILLIIGAASVAVPLALRVAASAPFEERLRVAVQLLDQVPLIDGHNDLPWNIRKFLHNKLNNFDFDKDLRNVDPWARSLWSHTDLQRLKRGRISAQFWAAYVPCEAQHRDAVQLTLEQIDVIKRLTDRYSPQLTTCTSAKDIIEAQKNHQLCSLTGVEGGHSLGGSLAVLRTLYAIGVRYMTLTSTCHTPWADSSYADAPNFNVKHGGLTLFGKTIIREMNRLGMMVDLSHVSTGTMRDALEVSEAPVIFSHSSAYELCNSSRNVHDNMLQSLAKNGGIVMVNFYSKFLACSENSTVHDAVAHINHIKRIAGIDHVGLGAGFDGINFTPKGLEDVSTYPTLFAELLGVGWSIEDLTKLAGGNLLRVMQQVEKVRDEKKAAGVKPYEDHPNFRTDDPYNCTSS